ncbi:unnamed protein product, partial [Iphiclides podalirius]
MRSGLSLAASSGDSAADGSGLGGAAFGDVRERRPPPPRTTHGGMLLDPRQRARTSRLPLSSRSPALTRGCAAHAPCSRQPRVPLALARRRRERTLGTIFGG